MAKRKASSTSSSSAKSSSTSRTRERREQREKEKRQQQRFLIIGGVVLGAIILAILLIVANQPADAPVPEELIARFEGIPQTQTEEGYYRLGRPDAPVRVEEFASFACAGCEQFFSSSFDGVVDLVRSGAISFTYIPQLTGELRNAEGAARAAICAGEQGKFFEYHDMLFDWHTRFGNTAFTQNRLRTGASNLGLDTSQFNSCTSSSRSSDIVEQAVAEGVSRGVTGTPATFVNGSPVEPSTLSQIETEVQQRLSDIGVIPIPITSGDAVELTPEVEMTAEATEESTPEMVEPTDEPVGEATEESGG